MKLIFSMMNGSCIRSRRLMNPGFSKKNILTPKGKNTIHYHDIDFYWNKVLAIVRSDGRPKYPTMSKLIKNILIISHGNADVERGFSINGNILTEERTLLSEKSINGLRSIYDAVDFLGNGLVHKVIIA